MPAYFEFPAGSQTWPRSTVINQDGTINTGQRPAQKGSVVTAYVTGAGVMTPPAVDGEIPAQGVRTPVAPVSVFLEGFGVRTNAEVLYAREAPGFVSGVLQIRFRIPDVPSLGDSPCCGNSAYWYFRIGDSVSNPVLIAVR
jgi:uncharacterized protein (TIGR03437 family)